MDLRVYGVTDPSCNAKQGRSNAEAVKAAIAGGMTLVQLREKDADGGDFCREARAVLEVARPKGVSLLNHNKDAKVLQSGPLQPQQPFLKYWRMQMCRHSLCVGCSRLKSHAQLILPA